MSSQPFNAHVWFKNNFHSQIPAYIYIHIYLKKKNTHTHQQKIILLYTTWTSWIPNIKEYILWYIYTTDFFYRKVIIWFVDLARPYNFYTVTMSIHYKQGFYLYKRRRNYKTQNKLEKTLRDLLGNRTQGRTAHAELIAIEFRLPEGCLLCMDNLDSKQELIMRHQ